VEDVHRATRVEALPESWRSYLLERLQNLDSGVSAG
jgi:3-alpha domain